MTFGTLKIEPLYVDVVNLDRDIAISTPFMRDCGVVLDFEKGATTIKGSWVDGLRGRRRPYGEETVE